MKLKKIFFMCAAVLFAVLLLIKPQISKIAVANAIMLSGQVLIPSLFPFCFCVLFIMQCVAIKENGWFSKITKKILGLPADLFLIFVFSMLGGYPIGAKLLNDAVFEGRLSPKDGGKMLCFCVNAGPGFIVAAVGNGLLHSKTLGLILLASHSLSSFLICLILHIITKHKYTFSCKTAVTDSIADRFVDSTSKAATTMLGIIGFVILFTVITAFVEHYSTQFTFLKPIVYLLEVTVAVTKTRNIYFLSALLGFSGVCIWCQVLSTGKSLKIKLSHFVLFRLIHALLSLVLTYILVKLFNPVIPTFSSGDNVGFAPTISNTAFSISLLIMALIFAISLFNRQNNTKILEDMI